MLFEHAPSAFSAPEEDLSFAWYVPLFSLYVLYCERSKIIASLGESSWGGFPLLLISLFTGFIGTRGIQLRFEELGFIGLLLALPWVFFGRRAAAAIAFPVLFLLFCIPLNSFLDIVTVHLRLFAVSVSYGILKGIGIEAVRRGTMLFVGADGFSIDVAAPCSGLRSLFAMMALTAGYAYFAQKTWLKRGILFACSIPIAIAGNVVRILSIAAIGGMFSAEFAAGFYHDYSGYVVFIAAIALMLAVSELLKRWNFPKVEEITENGIKNAETVAISEKVGDTEAGKRGGE